MWAQMAKNDLLTLIAQMAGRLTRLAHSAKRSQGPSHIGSVTGITRGGDLSRILPEELVGLRGGRLARLQVLGKIAARKTLQYAVSSPVPLGRGPLLVLLDKSDSMGMPRIRLAWSKAVALALLTLCREQGRTWACVTFDWNLSREVVVEDGQVSDQDALLRVILENASGGTRFDPPLKRALTLLTERPALKQADLIFVTDGAGVVSEEVEADLKARMSLDGLSLYAIGIGTKADLSPFAAWATAGYRLSSDPQASEGTIAPMLAQLA
jgi:uncharacterized protein with von Willebrand factor type A (vWA) domain